MQQAHSAHPAEGRHHRGRAARATGIRPIAAAAKAAGIPFISMINSTPTPFSINIAPNSVADALNSGATLAKLIGGKGVFGVHGIPSTGVDQQEFAGWKQAFAACP